MYLANIVEKWQLAGLEDDTRWSFRLFNLVVCQKMNLLAVLASWGQEHDQAAIGRASRRQQQQAEIERELLAR
ncbi:hypothetical protein CVT26_015323 [Gymnopilus dilepis]|uniref:Uncharacterized protein n=1 Tax=Gymnopilus dilepis TaxID=231916 RepID=A0A409YE74_9AGAR|nr:hypothetical protein CVT26_015323 [Gymnopilus dilepis]